METGCEACLSWHSQARFRHVCPLLVSTPDGLRCSVDTAQVRPFWGRAFGFYGGSLLAVYLAAAFSLFVFLRVVGYPVNIFQLVWPGSWHRVAEVRGGFFLARSQQAFRADRPAEGMLYLTNAYQFDPNNYTIAFTLAQRLQLSAPLRSDEVYRRLLRSHPAERDATAQAWFRALLARGDFPGVQDLARQRVLEDSAHAAVWLRALIFATRQTADDAPLRELLDSTATAARPWRQLLETELLRRSHQPDRFRAALKQPWTDAPAYALFYQISELTALGDTFEAADLIGRYGHRLDDTARATLLLETYAAADARQARQALVSTLLSPTLSPPTIGLLAAHLIRHPDAELFDQLYERFMAQNLPANETTLDAYLALYCAAGVVGDWHKLHAIAAAIRRKKGGNIYTLGLAEAFFRGQTPQTRIAGLISALPTFLEVHYALLERYPGPPRPAAKSPP